MPTNTIPQLRSDKIVIRGEAVAKKAKTTAPKKKAAAKKASK
jgi:hypothetical protein